LVSGLLDASGDALFSALAADTNSLEANPTASAEKPKVGADDLDLFSALGNGACE